MIFKKAFKLVSVVLGLSFAANVMAEDMIGITDLEIVPESGDYLTSQKFDIAVYLPPTIYQQLSPPFYDPSRPSPLRIQASVNGLDVSPWFHSCIQEHKIVATNERVLLCKNQDNFPLVEGQNIVKVFMYLDTQETYRAMAVYNLVKSERAYQPLPYRFAVPGTSARFGSGVQVSAGERVVITATGRVNVWPSNPTFPISTPRGTSATAATSVLPGAPIGALLVKIGETGRWLVAGERYILTADRAGELIFAVNDKSAPADIGDNTGSYEVYLTR